MYSPYNPHGVDELWLKFETSIIKQELCYVICDGSHFPNAKPYKMSQVEAKDYIRRLKTLKHVWIGTGHLMPIPWHFAIKEVSVDSWLLCDLIAMESQTSSIERDLLFIVEFIFWFVKNLKILTIPFRVNLSEKLEFRLEIDNTINETRIYR